LTTTFDLETRISSVETS